MEPSDKRRMAARILGDYPAECEKMLEFIDEFPELAETPAQFQERCGQIALACFWKERRSDPPDVWPWADMPDTERERYEPMPL
jgi:hypothetical protein